MKNIINTDECWLFAGNISPKGYGLITYWSSEKKKVCGTSAHRAMYQSIHGELPQHIQVDHLCRVDAMLNPKHLEAVTARINTLRGTSFAAVNARKTHCIRGHSYSDHGYRNPSNGWRCCVICRNIKKREAWHRAKLAKV